LAVKTDAGRLRVTLTGPLTVEVPAALWRAVPAAEKGGALVFDLAGLTALDINGSAQLLQIKAQAEKAGAQASVENLGERFAAIFELAASALEKPQGKMQPRPSFFEEIGQKLAEIKDDAVTLTSFTGELAVEFGRLILRPRSIRWGNVLSAAETAGVDSVPIVSLVSFLVGLIIAFQAAMILKIFGAEIYVADMVGLSVVRELGPLIAGIVLAGRSGSAFSAELGAMKAAEEVDAITTMGLSPVRELALPRVLASVLTTPPVTLMAVFMGILGGSLVLLALGYSMSVYWLEAISQVSMASYLIGVFKSFVFGFTLAAVGCQRGLAAGDGPGAVGRATTSGVVTNIVVIAVLDSLFAVIFYVLDI
jgi:phospholipid/cholesterol/gamma-HCH transport system permease protein